MSNTVDVSETPNSVVVVESDNTVSVTQVSNAVTVASPGPAGPDELSELQDVALSSPAAGEVLTYNGTTWENAAAGVPTGGATGQVLVKDSGTDYDTSWAQPGVPTVPPVVGEYMVGDFRGTVQNVSCNNNEMQAGVLYVPRSVTIDEIAVVVTVAASDPAQGRLGIYDADSDGKPNNLIVDAGLYDATTTGTKIISLSPAVTLPQGVVFLVNCRQSANSYQTRRFVFGSGPRRAISAVQALSNVPTEWGYRQTGVSGALPSTWTGTQVEQGAILITVRIASIV